MQSRGLLDILDQDVVLHPERLKPITAELARRAQSLVRRVSLEVGIPLPLDDQHVRSVDEWLSSRVKRPLCENMRRLEDSTRGSPPF